MSDCHTKKESYNRTAYMTRGNLIIRLPLEDKAPVKVPFLEYRSVMGYNRDVFSIQHGDLLKAFVAIDDNFSILVELPRTRRDRDGHSHVSLTPLLLLFQRQAHCAFDVLTAGQSYQGWLILRPGIEAALIVGKWVDDPQNAKIWQNRDKDPGLYQKAYTGKGLQSDALPDSDRIQSVLRRVNDRFVHANPEYYHRHLNVGPGDPGYVNIVVNYVDDDTLQLANVFAFLHVLLTVQESLLSLFNQLFTTEVKLTSPLAAFQKTFGKRIDALVRANAECRAVLADLGCWSEGST